MFYNIYDILCAINNWIIAVQISNTVDTCEGHLVPPVSSEVTIDGGEVYQSHDEEEDNDDGKQAVL